MSGKVKLSIKLLALLTVMCLAFLAGPMEQAQAEQPSLTSLEAAYDRLVRGYLEGSTEALRVYGLPEMLEGPLVIQNWKESITMGSGPGWVFFIDDHPMANWEHGCRYVFVTQVGEFHMERSTTPPRNMADFVELTTPPPAPNYHPLLKSDQLSAIKNAASNARSATDASKRWAVIISGGANQSNNHIRYWNDSAYFYQTLVANGFLDDHVYVLMSDGTDPTVDRSDGTNSPLDLDGDGDDDIQYAATAANITTVFNELAGLLDEDDILYIFTTDHGGSLDDAPYDDPDSVLYLWNFTTISDAAFAAEVDKVTTLATVAIFEQCFSGGMIDDLMAPNRVLMSAARFWELSYSAGDLVYDEFSYHATRAMAETGVGDANSDGKVSMEEAYLHALANDAWQSEALDYGDNTGEHPSYFSNPWDLGRKVSLQGLESGVKAPIYAQYRQYQVTESFPAAGTAQGWTGDNVCYTYELPFTFPYYQGNYSTVYVSTNGLIAFDGCDTAADNTVDGLKGKKAIAPLWDDLVMSNMYVDETASAMTIHWVGTTIVDARPVEFAARLSKNGNIAFFYGSGNNHTSLVDGRDKTIGISNGDGASWHLGLRNGEGALSLAASIEFLPEPAKGLPFLPLLLND